MSLMAVVKTGGKQYLVKKGDTFRIEKIAGKPGEKILFKEILLTFDPTKNKASIGRPYLKGISLEGKILAQEKSKKIKIIKYKPKTRYHKKTGHRQLFTKVKILKIKK